MGEHGMEWGFVTAELVADLERRAKLLCGRLRFRRLDPGDVVSEALQLIRELLNAGKLEGDDAAGHDRAQSRAVLVAAYRQLHVLGESGLRRSAKEAPDGAEAAPDWAEAEGQRVLHAAQPHGTGRLPTRESQRQELAARLARLVPAPTKTQVEVLVLRLRGLSFRAIAARLQRDASTVRERYRRLIRRLQGRGGSVAERLVPPSLPDAFWKAHPRRWREVAVDAERLGRADCARVHGTSARAVAALLRRVRAAARTWRP